MLKNQLIKARDRYEEYLVNNSDSVVAMQQLNIVKSCCTIGLRGVKTVEGNNQFITRYGNVTFTGFADNMIDILDTMGANNCIKAVSEFKKTIPPKGIKNNMIGLYQTVCDNLDSNITPKQRQYITMSMNYMLAETTLRKIEAEEKKKRINKSNKYKQLKFNFN